MLRPPIKETDHRIGNSDARVTLVEYGDYECPHCGHAYPLVKQLVSRMGKDLLFVFRHFPLQEAHPAAFPAALSAEAAGKQGKFWQMHDLLYDHQEELEENSFLDFAGELNLDLKKFSHDFESDDTSSKVEDDFESGVRSGVNGTPTFFINGKKLAAYDGTYESLENTVLLQIREGVS
jgi:protein-disulfide isomerase